MHWIAPSEELHHNDIRCFGVSGSDAFDLPREREVQSLAGGRYSQLGLSVCSFHPF